MHIPLLKEKCPSCGYGLWELDGKKVCYDCMARVQRTICNPALQASMDRETQRMAQNQNAE